MQNSCSVGRLFCVCINLCVKITGKFRKKRRKSSFYFTFILLCVKILVYENILLAKFTETKIKGGNGLNSKLKNDSTDYLFKAILSLENEEDCYRFFEDLCTSAEIKAMSQRLVVAKMLTEKKSIYRNC